MFFAIRINDKKVFTQKMFFWAAMASNKAIVVQRYFDKYNVISFHFWLYSVVVTVQL